MNVCEQCGSVYDPNLDICPYCGCDVATAYSEDESIKEFIKEKK